MRIDFPPLHETDDDGFLCHGGKYDLLHLQSAYEQGIFPWPSSDKGLKNVCLWFAPDPRGIIDLSQIHFPKSFLKIFKKNPFTVEFNRDFETVIKHCANPLHRNPPETWITPELQLGILELFQAKKAYCVSTYLEGKLVGGLYGVCLGNFITAESMFFLESHASKFALHHLINHCKNKKISFIDTQMVTPLVELFGGLYISRDSFMNRFKNCDLSYPYEKIFNR